jgi:hypothetical protein
MFRHVVQEFLIQILSILILQSKVSFRFAKREDFDLVSI